LILILLIIIKIKIFITKIILFLIVILLIIIKIKIFKIFYQDPIKLGHTKPIELAYDAAPKTIGSCLRPKIIRPFTMTYMPRGAWAHLSTTWRLGDSNARGRSKRHLAFGSWQKA
jgi:hypothetical protein